MLSIVTIGTPSLGDRSYLAHDGSVAIVFDPQRDIDRVLQAASSEGARVTHVFETHIHNDYVTGGRALADATGAAYVVPGGDDVTFDRVPARDGSRWSTGRLEVTALATPGHTQNHLSYQVEVAGRPEALFTGGSMLFGAVGRTDLVSEARTLELTRAQFRSVRRLAAMLPDDVEVYPTHGFGSFCSASEARGDSSTIGNEKAQNIALTEQDEDTFVKTVIAGLNAYPRYYAHMAAINLGGPAGSDLSPPYRLDAPTLRRRIDAGEWVVDLRPRRAFAQEHIEGTISVELDGPFPAYLGWALPWGVPVNVVGSDEADIARAQRELSRIGLQPLAGAAAGRPGELGPGRSSSYPVAGFGDLRAGLGRPGLVVLDVRRRDEWDAGHVEGAVHVPFWEVESRVGEVPNGEPWVYCASGARASISASLLARAGRRPVLVDDEWEQAGRLGLPIASS